MVTRITKSAPTVVLGDCYLLVVRLAGPSIHQSGLMEEWMK